jgi:hypothetical protein
MIRGPRSMRGPEPDVHRPAQNVNADRSTRRLEVLTAVVTMSSIFWDITPCSQLKVNRRFGGTYRLSLQSRRICQARNQESLPHVFTLVSCLAYSSTLKMEATCSSETLVDFQLTTRYYSLEARTLHICSHNNQKGTYIFHSAANF